MRYFLRHFAIAFFFAMMMPLRHLLLIAIDTPLSADSRSDAAITLYDSADILLRRCCHAADDAAAGCQI